MNIPRSTFYYHRKHPKKKGYTAEEEAITVAEFHKYFGSFGRRTIRQTLKENGIILSERKISKILKANDLVAKYGRPKAKNIHTHPDLAEKILSENVYWRLPKEKRPQKVWSTDFTEQKINGKAVYTCGIISINDHILVGMKSGMPNNSKSACETLKEAVERFGVPDMILTDRGAPFTSKSFHALLEEYKITHSMSRAHTPRDNRYIESFWHTMKTEIGQVVKYDIHEYLMVMGYYAYYYNNIRPHSRLGYRSPIAAAITNNPKS